VIASLALGCRDAERSRSDGEATEQTSPHRESKGGGERDPAIALEDGEGAVDRGDAVLRFRPAKKTLYRGLHDKLRRSPMLSGLLNDLNEQFAWPREVVVEFRECGEANAFYEPEGPTVVMCHELVDYLVDVFDPHVQNQARADRMVIGAVAFMLLHELGHALVDAHSVPITGRVEDAVDQLATWLLVTHMRGGGKLALSAAAWFALAQSSDRREEMLWDEHSLDAQRFYNIVCWVYGASPKEHRYLVSSGRLPKERAKNCDSEFDDFAGSFEVLLAPAQKVREPSR